LSLRPLLDGCPPPAAAAAALPVMQTNLDSCLRMLQHVDNCNLHPDVQLPCIPMHPWLHQAYITPLTRQMRLKLDVS
jgi:hypothetical protein